MGAMEEFFSDEFYPGSKKKRPELPGSVIEFHSESWRDGGYDKNVGGKTVRFYTVGSLATALGVSVQGIRKWIAAGYIPDAPYRLPANMKITKLGEGVSGRRLYTEEMIDAAVDVFQDRGLLGVRRVEWKYHDDVSIEIHQRWKSLMEKNSAQEGIRDATR